METRAGDEITLVELFLRIREWFLYLKTKWVIIILSGAVCGSLGFIKAYLSKPEYTATLSFALEEDKGGGMGGAIGLASQLGFDLGGNAGGAFSSANLLELMKSRRLVEKTLLNSIIVNGKQTTLAELYMVFNKWHDLSGKHNNKETIHFLPNSNRLKFSRLEDSTLGQIYKSILSENLTVNLKDKKTSINVIEVKSRDEFFSKIFAESLASEVSKFYIETKTKKSMQNVAILQKQVDSVRSELNSALIGTAILTDNIYGLNPAMNIKKVSPAKRQIDVQANTAILAQLGQNLEISKMALMRETPLIQIIDTPVLPLKKDKDSKRNGLLYGGFVGVFGSISILVLLQLSKKIAKLKSST